MDTDHEDLKEVIWVNEDEIPNNKKDDDNNGYVDDINGWNFLGQSDKENFEYVRLFKKSSPNDKMRSVYENEIFQAIEKNNQTISRIQDLSKLLLKPE